MSSRKAALVTASSAGLGAAIARVLVLELGMDVTVNYSQNAERAEALIRELQDAWSSRHPADPLPPPSLRALRADLTQKSDVVRLVEDAAATSGGRLDVVISNGGWTKVRNFADLDDGVDEEDWDRCYAANVKSHLWLFHAAKRFLEEANVREEGAAVFVSTASTAGCKPSGSSLVRVLLPSSSLLLDKLNGMLTISPYSRTR